MPYNEINKNIKQYASYPKDFIGPIEVMPKDSYAVAAGFKAILEINGDFRGLAPSALNSTVSSKDGDTIQVICGKADGGDLSGFLGVYYTCSFNGGVTWSSPELITSAGPFSRNYCEIAACEGQFPYVVVGYMTLEYSGDWFTTDPIAPGSGSWTTPILISDTADYAAYMPTVAVNGDGDKVSVIAYDLTGGIGSNYSGDYGYTWNVYNIPSSIGDSVLQSDVSCARWGAGDTVYALLGMSWQNELRKDIIGAEKASFNGLSVSTDAGASWSAPTGLFYNSKRPNIRSVNGDTFTYYMDTLKGNGRADSIPVKCYLNESTGLWADERGSIDSDECGFGTWWYWWDAEYFEENSTLFYAIPVADLFFDYYIQPGGDLYTFPFHGQSLLFGFKNDSSSQFIYDYIDLHDGEILDSTGRSSTWRGNLFSTNIVYDRNTGAVYIIYQDYVDTATGESSIEALRINNHFIYRATIALNAASYIAEAASYVTEDGYVHVTMCSGMKDSIYYKAIDLYDASLVWTYIGYSNYPKYIDDIYPPNPFDLISPCGNTTDSTPTFIWHKSEGGYMCEYDVYINNSIAVTVTETTWTQTTPITQGEYAWYVRVTDYFGLSAYSNQTDTFRFDTEPPMAPELVSPADNSQTHYPIFTWKEATDNIPGKKKYRLWYDYDSIFSSPDSVVTFDTTCTVSLDAHQYYWKVRATDLSDNEGEWSDIWYFIYTPAGMDIEKSSAPAEKTSLSVGMNVIKYSAMTSDNELIIYDVSGKTVYADKGFKKGSHKILTENMRSGIYFIKFRDSEKTISMKAVIVK